MWEYYQQVVDLYAQLFSSDWKIIAVLITVVIVLGLLWFITFAARRLWLKTLFLVVNLVGGWVVGSLIGNFWVVYPGLLLLPSLLLGLLLYVLSPFSEADRENEHTVVFRTRFGKIFIDISEHLGVFGSTGAGKTDSCIVPIIQHIFKWGLSSVIFDYKDFELMEKVYGILEAQRKKNLELERKGRATRALPKARKIYFQDPNLSDQINPIDPMYLEKMEDVEDISNTLFDNLYPGEGKEERFFKESGAAAFAGTVWRFKEDYRKLCSFPYVCAVLVLATAEQLIQFIEKSPRAKVLAAPFLDAAGNRRQLSSAKSSITAAIKKISTPDMFMVLRKSDFDLTINRPDNLTVLGLVNVPRRDSVYLPVIATIARMTMNQCSIRGRNYSPWIFDEGSALKFNNFERVLATLRTFKVIMVWALQDKVQGKILYNEDILKAVLANLNVKFLGIANEPDTAEYYSRIFGTHEVVEKSTSSGRGGVTTSRRKVEKRVYKPIEFRRLLKGVFFVADNQGKDRKVRLKKSNYTTQKPNQVYFFSREEIDRHYDQVMQTAGEIIAKETTDLEVTDID